MNHTLDAPTSLVAKCLGLMKATLIIGSFLLATHPATAEVPISWNVVGVVVDETGQPMAEASIRPVGPSMKTLQTHKTTSSGSFIIPQQPRSLHSAPMLIRSKDGRKAGWVNMFRYEENRPIEAVVAPIDTCQVEVVDSAGNPVKDAETHVFINHLPVETANTNDQGIATFQIPPNASVQWLFAKHPDFGMSYYENFDAWPPSDSFRKTPEQVKLQLSPSDPVRIKIIDTTGEPIEGINVMPWTIQIPDRLNSVNLSGMHGETTNAQGEAHFSWIPQVLSRHVTFLSSSTEYHIPRNPTIETTNRSAEATAMRLGTLRGKVLMPDGSPAKGIMLQCEGRGNTNMYFRGYEMSDAKGEFEFSPYPDQDLMIAVTDQKWAARSLEGIRLQEGEVLENLELRLIQGTLITGTTTMGDSRAPVIDETATLVQDPNRSNLVRWSRTNSAGKFRFRVGPGDYNLKLPLSNEYKAVRVTDEDQLVFDSHADRPLRGQLIGFAFDEKGNLIEGAEVFGESTNAPGHAGFSTKSNSEGRFDTERWHDDMLILGRDSSKNLVALAHIGPDEETAELLFQNANSLSGNLVINGLPVAENTRVLVLITVHHDNASARFRFPLLAGQDGSIELNALPSNIDGRIMVAKDDKPFLFSFQMGDEPGDLGSVELKAFDGAGGP